MRMATARSNTCVHAFHVRNRRDAARSHRSAISKACRITLDSRKADPSLDKIRAPLLSDDDRRGVPSRRFPRHRGLKVKKFMTYTEEQVEIGISKAQTSRERVQPTRAPEATQPSWAPLKSHESTGLIRKRVSSRWDPRASPLSQRSAIVFRCFLLLVTIRDRLPNQRRT